MLYGFKVGVLNKFGEGYLEVVRSGIEFTFIMEDPGLDLSVKKPETILF
jgi:hypothetical protein